MNIHRKNLWEMDDWPNFTWQISALKPKLDQIRLLQGKLIGKLDDLPATFEHQAQVDILVENVMRNRGVENQRFDLEDFISSATGFSSYSSQSDKELSREPISSLLTLWINVVQKHQGEVALDDLIAWHRALFADVAPAKVNQILAINNKAFSPEASTLDEVHIEAPPRANNRLELLGFLRWFNLQSNGVDGLIRAGITHLWLVILQPFDVGNKRISRVLTDLALAQAEPQSIKYYSMSSAININQSFYEQAREKMLSGSLDVTAWLCDFLTLLEESIQLGIARINHFMRKTHYWQKHSQTVLNARQLKLLNDLLDAKESEGEDEASIYASKYMDITQVSKATATRELTDLLQKHCIRKLPGGGRSTRYVIA